MSLHGTDDRLYGLVARLVMDPDVLRKNNNYPFKTTARHTWHLCLENGVVTGFLPAKDTVNGLYVDNYYISDDNREILDGLINHLLASTDKPVTVLCHKRHAGVFRSHGFVTGTVFAQYNRMRIAGRKGEERG